MPRVNRGSKLPAEYHGQDSDPEVGRELVVLNDATLLAFRLVQRGIGYTITILLPLEEGEKLPALREGAFHRSVQLVVREMP